MAISDEQKTQLYALCAEKKLSSQEIADQVGVSRGAVAAIKAHISRKEGGATGTTDAESEELVEATEITFGLERDMQAALRNNIEQLEPGLKIDDNGKERNVSFGGQAQGWIDITARDSNDALVVIELKAGKAAPEALTQLLSYMGALASPNEKPVRGVLVADDFHPKVIFGASTVPNVQLRKYSISFSFKEISKTDIFSNPIASSSI